MKKYATVKFIGNQSEYASGKYCDEYVYCRDCPKAQVCVKEKTFHFINGNEYKTYFLGFCQGKRDVLEIENQRGERLDFVPICDFQVVSDVYEVLNRKQAIVKCIMTNGQEDLTVGKNYIVLKADDTDYYVLDDSNDCYYYPKTCFVLVEDPDGILG